MASDTIRQWQSKWTHQTCSKSCDIIGTKSAISISSVITRSLIWVQVKIKHNTDRRCLTRQTKIYLNGTASKLTESLPFRCKNKTRQGTIIISDTVLENTCMSMVLATPAIYLCHRCNYWRTKPWKISAGSTQTYAHAVWVEVLENRRHMHLPKRRPNDLEK